MLPFKQFYATSLFLYQVFWGFQGRYIVTPLLMGYRTSQKIGVMWVDTKKSINGQWSQNAKASRKEEGMGIFLNRKSNFMDKTSKN